MEKIWLEHFILQYHLFHLSLKSKSQQSVSGKHCHCYAITWIIPFINNTSKLTTQPTCGPSFTLVFIINKHYFLPQARTDWINLRVLDFPDFISFNSELHRIMAQLRLCEQTVTDAELIEKTLSTFLPATTILS